MSSQLMATFEDDLRGQELFFSAAFPLPFRVLCLAGLGILGWATNLHGLHAMGLDPTAALELHRHDGHRLTSALPSMGWKSSLYPASVYAPVYRLFFAYSACALSTWLVFRYATYSDYLLVDEFKFIPAVAVLLVLTALICPFNVFEKNERDRFLRTIQRCLFPPAHHPIYFADVVFADVFTSYAKVIGDVWLSFLMLLPGSSLFVQSTQDGLSRWILPTLMSLPYAVRLRQCLIEYKSPSNHSRRPLYNALKYATSFPVIYLSAAQRLVISELVDKKGAEVAREAWHGEHQLFRLWLLAALVNSLYSFWWDVTYDWGCDLLLPRRSTPQANGAPVPPKPLVLPHLHSRSLTLGRHSSNDEELKQNLILDHTRNSRDTIDRERRYPFGLRPVLLFPLSLYPFAILVDLVLRLTWSAKLSSHLHSYSEGDLIIFWIELAEVVRRWMWVFIRVEWEVVKQRRGGKVDSPSMGRISRHYTDEEHEMTLPQSDGYVYEDG